MGDNCGDQAQGERGIGWVGVPRILLVAAMLPEMSIMGIHHKWLQLLQQKTEGKWMGILSNKHRSKDIKV